MIEGGNCSDKGKRSRRCGGHCHLLIYNSRRRRGAAMFIRIIMLLDSRHYFTTNSYVISTISFTRSKLLVEFQTVFFTRVENIDGPGKWQSAKRLENCSILRDSYFVHTIQCLRRTYDSCFSCSCRPFYKISSARFV